MKKINDDKKKEIEIKNSKINLQVSFFLALKNLFFKINMFVLIVGIVALGFISMTFISGAILGLQETVVNNNIAFNTGNILIEPVDDENFIKNTFEIEKKVLALNEVKALSSQYVERVTFIDDNDNTMSSQINIVDYKREMEVSPIKESITYGSFFSDSELDGIIMPEDLVEGMGEDDGDPDETKLNIKIGELVDLVTTSGEKHKVKVLGFYANEGFGGGKIYMTREYSKQFFNLTNDDFDLSSQIMVKTFEKGNEAEIIKSLERFNINAKINSWEDKLGGVKDFIGSLLLIGNFTSIFGLIVSFFTVFIMIYMNVFQKKSQIGIMKAVGINENTILTSYIIQSLFYGVLGSLVGFLIVKSCVFYFSLNPIVLPMGDIVPFISSDAYLNAVMYLIGSCLVAGFFASKGIIKENILDAIFKG